MSGRTIPALDAEVSRAERIVAAARMNYSIDQETTARLVPGHQEQPWFLLPPEEQLIYINLAEQELAGECSELTVNH